MRNRVAAALLFLVPGCIPDHETRPSLIDQVAIIAVRGEPAEAEPESEVAFSLLVASPDGAIDEPDARWSFCTAPRAPVESGPVSPACVDRAEDGFGEGPAAAAPIPEEACSLHGPDIPPGDFRPRDPDSTGGYYQPVRIDLAGTFAFGAQRIACNLANAPVDLVRQFRDGYRMNQNPTLLPIEIGPVAAGDEIDVVAEWGPEGAESYLYFDPIDGRLVTRREAMSVSWFANAGRFDSDRTGRGEEEEATTSSNRWTAPDTLGPVHFWIVLRDSRGGTAWLEADLEVTP